MAIIQFRVLKNAEREPAANPRGNANTEELQLIQVHRSNLPIKGTWQILLCMSLWSNSCWFCLLLILKLQSTCRRKSHILTHFWVSARQLFFYALVSAVSVTAEKPANTHLPAITFSSLRINQYGTVLCVSSPKPQAWEWEVWKAICFRWGMTSEQSASLIFKDSLRLSLHRSLILSKKRIRLYKYYLFSQHWTPGGIFGCFR